MILRNSDGVYQFHYYFAASGRSAILGDVPADIVKNLKIETKWR